MIRIIKGFYCFMDHGEVRRVYPGDDPIQLTAQREKELITSGYAEQAPEPVNAKRQKKVAANDPDGDR